MATQENYADEICLAAMYQHLGSRTKISASGYSVIFAEGYRLNGRADLSAGIPGLAAKQMEFAGIDPGQLTQQQIDDYRKWQTERDREHSLNGATIVVTGTRHPERGNKTWNEVWLRDGRGELLSTHIIKCIDEWDSETRNEGGGIGGFRSMPDTKAIDAAIKQIQTDFPDYSHVPVQR